MDKLKKKTSSEITSDLIAHVNWSTGSKVWLGCLCLALLVCLFFYFLQLKDGLGVTGLNDIVSWGIYISSFVFFVAVSLIGMLISSVLGLLKIQWIKPIARIAEIVAVAFAMVAGLVIITDMGRPDRLHNVFLFGRLQSPIVWDISVVITYVTISTMLLFLPLIPDMKYCYENENKLPKIQRKLYKWMSLGFSDKKSQYKLLHKYMRVLMILVIPVALAIHTVTSWLFAMTLRAGWDSSIFGPYFVVGAFVAGVAGVVIAMFFFRNSFKLKDYIRDEHFDKMGKLLILVSLVYIYFNLNEIIVPAYKLKASEAGHLSSTLWGHDSHMFWFVQLGGLLIPTALLLIPKMRKPLPIMLISIVVLIGAWLKRYLIVIPIQQHPFLPVQGVPEEWVRYSPTTAEIAITAGTLILVLIIITILSKLFPVVPIWEIKEEVEDDK